MSTKQHTSTNHQEFAEMIQEAKAGKPKRLNHFFSTLYLKGKQSLLSLTNSESDAEDYFSAAVSKFWQKFIVEDAPLPKTNIEGYIYTISKFLCLDDKRSNKKLLIVPEEELAQQHKSVSLDSMKPAVELEEETHLEHLRSKALEKGIAKLGHRCQTLFKTILKTGLEKSRDLFTLLDLKDARAVTVLRYECTKQLKVKAALELELLLSEENYG